MLRGVQNLEKEFQDQLEAQIFVSIFAPLLAEAMQLRGRELSPPDFHSQASWLKERIID